MRTTAMWLLVGVFALLGGQQPSEAGSGGLPAAHRTPGHHRASAVARYVALGDSYTAGSGITPDDGTGCLRSDRNYPTRLADRLGAHLDDASCGGATTEDADQEQWTPNGMNPPQLAEIDRRTDLVTVSLGINDAQFGVLLIRCLQVAQDDPAGHPCRDSFRTADGGDQVLGLLPRVGDHVERVVRLAQRKGPDAQVVVVGYPQLVPRAGVCAQLPFALGDYAYLAEFMVELNDELRTAARHTGAAYVDVLAASEGHDVCAGPDAWTLGALSDPRTQVFHPFANEQRAIATLVAAQLR